MLSYRHAFHAGNHADVLKHLVLVRIARYMGQKDKPFSYIDTHAGAGAYALDEGYATKLAEYREGVGRLWERTDLPAPVADYLAQVRELNEDGALKVYPGSPWLARQTLREQDKLRLFELHPSDSALLEENFSDLRRRAQVSASDGFQGLRSVLPPPSRRALVLIDPSYEIGSDYSGVVAAQEDALRRFATGTYVLWYPELLRPESRQLPEKLKRLPAEKWLHVALSVRAPGPGMFGSGLFVINPPFTLRAELETCLPWLVKVLGEEAGARFVLESAGD
ncbi:23S rRNA (adenine(2030)-N(6))-methyltransferase RlmJ [Niveibacterium sp. SC-1]|uniref:23S rRNA (adenine(2030)-N(6))-methyltransferase RlmJ n=1 Tax=Niveibacterium sp. SC-1 TaxID=3135646 RepID=UPI0031203FF5